MNTDYCVSTLERLHYIARQAVTSGSPNKLIGYHVSQWRLACRVSAIEVRQLDRATHSGDTLGLHGPVQYVPARWQRCSRVPPVGLRLYQFRFRSPDLGTMGNNFLGNCLLL